LNTLVNFESALPSINGQFSVGVNTHKGACVTFGHAVITHHASNSLAFDLWG
jgi:hypothetical protein